MKFIIIEISFSIHTKYPEPPEDASRNRIESASFSFKFQTNSFVIFEQRRINPWQNTLHEA